VCSLAPGLAVRRDIYGDWQLAGRSAAGPVHCPLWPAPLPPFVGGAGLAQAGVTPTAKAPQANTSAVIFLMLRSRTFVASVVTRAPWPFTSPRRHELRPYTQLVTRKFIPSSQDALYKAIRA
jgi:hypothetical protein